MIGHFKRLEDIGRGSFATVYRGVHVVCDNSCIKRHRKVAIHSLIKEQKKRSLVAIKSVQLYKLNNKLKANLHSEIKILRSLHHPHIVALIDCQESTNHIHLVMEFCQLGDLSAFIKKRQTLVNHPTTAEMIRKYPNPSAGGLNEVVVRHFLQQIASALEFLRARNYVHRDIKPQNLLLNPSPHFFARHKPELMPLTVTANSLVPAAGIESLPMLKVADFGFARVLPQTSLAETLCGSPLYMAPEILRYERYDAKADLWSVGTVLHEMIISKPPFRASNHVELLRKIERQDDRIKFPEDVEVSGEMKHLIRALLKKQPTERMSFESFFEHQVVKETIPGLVEDDLPHRREEDSEVIALSKQMQNVPMNTDEPLESEDTQNDRESPYVQSSRRERPSHTPTSPSRPIQPSTPPGSSPMSRRHSNSPAMDSYRQRLARPGLPSAITAPSRQELHQEQYQTAAAAAMRRQRSGPGTSSGSSSSRERQQDRARISSHVHERSSREIQESAAQDVAFERDYVLVEKRAVEVNAFADELAASPQLHGRKRSPPHHRKTVTRRATATGATPPTAANMMMHASPSQAVQHVSNKQQQQQRQTQQPHRPEASHQRAGSYERRYGPNPGSATSAISKALNLANLRLFGMGVSPPLGKGMSPPKGYGGFPSYPAAAQGALTLIGDGGKTVDMDEDAKVLYLAEELATRSDVVYSFAEIKYKQLLPATPSHIVNNNQQQQRQGLGLNIDKAGNAAGAAADVSVGEGEDDDLTIDATIAVAEEALVLYVKALAILAKSIDLAGGWWGYKTRNEAAATTATTTATNETIISPRSRSPRTSAAIGSRMNSVVQWSRNRFNECLEKSEFVGQKLVEALKQLPLDHPNHPNNQTSNSSTTASASSSTATGAANAPAGPVTSSSIDNINLITGVTAEKLMYERAVEMSRTAAVNELVGEDLAGCEIAYTTAIRMLEAVLDGAGGFSSGGTAGAGGTGGNRGGDGGGGGEEALLLSSGNTNGNEGRGAGGGSRRNRAGAGDDDSLAAAAAAAAGTATAIASSATINGLESGDRKTVVKRKL